MPRYSNRRPDAGMLQLWVEKDLVEWLHTACTKKKHGTLISMLLAAEKARREERERIESERQSLQRVAEAG
jgi:hypothetical protein